MCLRPRLNGKWRNRRECAQKTDGNRSACGIVDETGKGTPMICPACRNNQEMAYSVLSHSFICLDPTCSYEIEMDASEAELIESPVEDLVCV